MKKIFLIILVLISIISLSAVCASENTTPDSTLQTDDIELNEKISTDNIQENKTFEYIENLISSSQDGDTIELEGTYTGNGNYITNQKTLTIIGVNEGATLDARNLSHILHNLGNLTLKNINFINGNGSEYHGGAIYSQGHLTVTDCTFTSNYAYNGGAINNEGTLTINECTFSKNTAKYDGAAIFNRFGNLTITNSNFKDNKYDSSLIDCYSSFVTVNNITVEDNKFTGYNNNGLVFSKCNSNIKNCNFTIPIVISGDGCLTECSFENTRLNLYMNIDNNTFKNCEIGFYKDNIIFSNNLLDNTSLKIFSINTTVKNSIFKNYNDYPIHAFNNLTNINGCTFENSTGAIKLENYNDYKMDLNIINSTFNNISKTAIDMKMYYNKQNNSIFIDNCKINKCKDGIILNGNNVTILNCELLNIENYAIFAYGDNPHINNCSFENTKNGIRLEGKYKYEGYISAKNIEITNSKFKDNEYAINVYAKKLTVVNCSIDSNKKYGIINNDNSSTIINCTVTNSRTAMILNSLESTDAINIIDKCKFINNSEFNGFTTIDIDICNQTIISNSIFINNTVEKGTVCSYQEQSRLIVNNSKFINNTASERGGGILSYGPTKIVNCLFQQNKAKIGSSISFISTNRENLIENCTFIDNIAKNNWDVSGYSELKITQTGYYYGDIVLKVTYTNKLTNEPIYDASLEGFNSGFNEDVFTNYTECLTLYNSIFKTSKEGTITIKIGSLKEGTYKFCVLDDENGKLETINITVKKAPTKIVASKLTAKYDQNSYYTVKVLNSKTKKGIANLKVTITVSGKKITATTDKNGNAKFSLSKFALGTNKLQISVSDPNVNSAKATSTLKLNKAKTIITAPKVTAKYKKSAYFKVTVKTASKKLVKNTKVKVKIGSKTYNVKTNSKGVAQVNTKSLKIGTHKVSISSGDSRFIMSKKSTIVIKR